MVNQSTRLNLSGRGVPVIPTFLAETSSASQPCIFNMKNSYNKEMLRVLILLNKPGAVECESSYFATN